MWFKWQLLGGAVFIALCLFFLWHAWPDDQVHVTFCDVGQGDSILITHGFTQVIVDGGPDDSVLECLQNHLPFWDHTLELVVNTHPDADHLGGIPSILTHYQVKQIWIEGRAKDSQLFRKFHELLKEKYKEGINIEFPQAGNQISLDSLIYLTVLSPPKQIGQLREFLSWNTETQLSAINREQEYAYGEANNGSIVLLLRVGWVSFLLTGDIEESTELALLHQPLLTDVNVLKAAHHGSKTSNTIKFLQKVKPETVVISVGKHNKYGHPHDATLKNFQTIGATVFRTDELGSIEIITDGVKYWKKEEKQLEN